MNATQPIVETCNDGQTYFNLCAEGPDILHQLSGATGAAKDILHERLVVTSCEQLPSGRWSISGYTLPREGGAA
jgi:hypothetical protein